MSERQARPCWGKHEEPQPDACLTCKLFLFGTDSQKWAIAKSAGVDLPDTSQLKSLQAFEVVVVVNEVPHTYEGTVLIGGDGRRSLVFAGRNRPAAQVEVGIAPCRFLGAPLTSEERQRWNVSPSDERSWRACLHHGRSYLAEASRRRKMIPLATAHALGGPVCPCKGCGSGCPGYDAESGAEMNTWAVGVTTVPERRAKELPRTLQSLAVAGFPRPRLFVDGADGGYDYPAVTYRQPRLGAFGNWYASLLELYIREPACQRYAIFQDDLVCVSGLRAYLDSCKFPERSGYWNLFTFLESDKVVQGKCGWVEGPMLGTGIDPAEKWQSGRGALALVFSREGVQLLLAARSMAEKPASATHPRDRIDGAVVTAMNLAGWREHVHGPSLVSHTGVHTTIVEPGKAGKVWSSNATTFPGEDVDIRKLMSLGRGAEHADAAAVDAHDPRAS